MSDRALAWLGIGLGLVGAGLQLVFPQPVATYVGWGLIGVGIVICLVVLSSSSVDTLRLRGRRKSTTRIVRWLNRCADYGTSHIQNARVQSGEDVVRWLRPRFDEWNSIIVEGAQHYCLETDAKDVEYLDSYTPRGFTGVTPEHAHIKEMTRETVARLRKLAGRLERGETRLRT